MDHRLTEARHTFSAGLHAAPARVALQQLLQAQSDSLSCIGGAIDALAIAADAAAQSLIAGGRMGYAGAGSSGLMALSDCLELAGTFGIAPARTPMMFAGGTAGLLHMTGGVEDDPMLALQDFAASGLDAGDAVICVSASGNTPYTVRIAELARDAGVTVIGVANTAESLLMLKSDVAICLPTGPEVVSGSTRMAAATAQKVALNMLSVLVGIRLGHVHDGYMVNLVADNAKLVQRAARIVAAISGSDETTAQRALAQTDGAVKPAILVARGHSPDAARAALAKSQGHLSGVL